LEEVGQVLGLVRQRVQQIEAAALKRLRKRAHAMEWQTRIPEDRAA
jgi:DNA-directed RNA polymerase sigma subunit (sigma70/sigma32)